LLPQRHSMHYLLSFFGAAVLALAFTPLALITAVKYRAFDRRACARSHDKVVPCWAVWRHRVRALRIVAGLAVVAGFARPRPGQDAGIHGGRLLVFGIGLYDDLRDASVGIRFLVQFLAAGILVLAGFNIRVLPNPLGGSFGLGFFSYPSP